MAAIDVSALGTAVLENIQAVSLVGTACLGIWGAISAFRVLREVLGFGPAVGVSAGGGAVSGDDYWDGYTIADDAQDRASAALDAVYARASAMAAAGEGQSERFKDETVRAAFEAGYGGGNLGDSADPATQAAWHDGRAAREEDRVNGMN